MAEQASHARETGMGWWQMRRGFFMVLSSPPSSPAFSGPDSAFKNPGGEGHAGKKPPSATAGVDSSGGQDIQGAVPPFTEGIFPCTQCHDGKTVKLNTTPRKLVDMHDDIVLKHGPNVRWCLDCHSAEHRDLLHLVDGQLIDFSKSYLLLRPVPRGQAARLRVGVHGKRTGEWNGKKQYLYASTATTRTRPTSSRSSPCLRPSLPPRSTSMKEAGHERRAPKRPCAREISPPGAGPLRIHAASFWGPRATAAAAALLGCKNLSTEEFLQYNFRELKKEELGHIIARLEKEYSAKLRKAGIGGIEPPKRVVFGYALDLSRCIGCRRCVYACVEENNQSRDPQIHWIRVLEMEKEKGVDFWHADPYYNPRVSRARGHFYMPVQCQQCENPPCTKVCPVGPRGRSPTASW